MAQSQSNKLKTVIGIFLTPALLFALLYAVKQIFAPQGNYTGFTFFITRIVVWIELGIIFLYAAKVEHQPFLLWKDKKYVWWKIILFVIIVVVLCGVGSGIANIALQHFGTKAESPAAKLMMHLLQSNLPLLVFTCLTAGVTEELLFRGYLIPRLSNLLKSPISAVIISALFFGILHFNWGTWIQIIGPFWIGLVYGFFYWKYRNLKVLMIIHFLWDLCTLLLSAHTK